MIRSPTGKSFTAIAFLASFGAAAGAEVSAVMIPETGSDRYHEIRVGGQISAGDSTKLADLVTRRLHIDLVGRVVIDSPGGSVEEALRMAEIIRKYHLQLSVEEKGCYSACFFLFAAAPVRFALGPVGIHRIYIDPSAGGRITLSEFRDINEDAWKATENILERYQVPQYLIDLARSTPSEEMYVLTSRDLVSFPGRQAPDK